ncbi:hypothetical protein GGF31_007026 [Allomyces arbusculus]|nr:hypothetical protein GGF31_007026 [Allomyces arbusculus]
MTRTANNEANEVQYLTRELQRLTAENNALHQQLVDAADVQDQQARKTALVVRRLENELADVKFLNAQLLTKVAAEQRKCDEERKRVDDLFKRWQVWSGTKLAPSSGMAKRFQPQKMELTTGLEPLAIPPFLATAKIIDPHVVDVVKVAEAKIREMEARVEEAELREADLKLQIQDLRAQVRTRDDEIHRLSNLMEGRKAPEPASRVEHLEAQVDFLQETITQLEAEKARTTTNDNELRRLREQNAHLMKSLADLEAEVHDLRSMSMDSELIHELQEEVQALHELLQTARNQYSHLTHEYEALLARQEATTARVDEGLQPEPVSASLPATAPAAPLSMAPPSAAVPPPPPPVEQPIVKWALEHELADAHSKLRQYATLETQLDRLRTELCDLHAQCESQAAQMKALQTEKTQLQTDLDEANAARNELLDHLHSLDHATEELTAQVQTVVAQKENLEQMYHQLLDRRDAEVHDEAERGGNELAAALTAATECEKCMKLTVENVALKEDVARRQRDLDAVVAATADLKAQANSYVDVCAQLAAAQRQLETIQQTNTQLNATVQQQLAIIQQQSRELTDLKLDSEKHARNALIVQQLERDMDRARSELQSVQSLLAEANQTVNQRTAQVNRMHQQIQEIEMEKKNLTTEINNVATDLTTLIKENQLLNNDLHTATLAKQQHLQEAALLRNQIQALQNDLQQKDAERHQLLVQYKKLVTQHETKADARASMQAALDQYRLDLLVKDKKIAQLSAALDQLRGRHEATVQELDRVAKDRGDHAACEHRVQELLQAVETLRQRNEHLERMVQEERLRAHKLVLASQAEAKTLKDQLQGKSAIEARLERELAETRRQLDNLSGVGLPPIPVVSTAAAPPRKPASAPPATAPAASGSVFSRSTRRADSEPKVAGTRATGQAPAAAPVAAATTPAQAKLWRAKSTPPAVTPSNTTTTATPSSNSNTTPGTVSTSGFREWKAEKQAIQRELAHDDSVMRRKQAFMESAELLRSVAEMERTMT